MSATLLDPTTPAADEELSSLRETVANLEAQLVSLYAEREAEASAIAALTATVESLEAQLVSLYAERDADAAR